MYRSKIYIVLEVEVCLFYNKDRKQCLQQENKHGQQTTIELTIMTRMCHENKFVKMLSTWCKQGLSLVGFVDWCFLSSNRGMRTKRENDTNMNYHFRERLEQWSTNESSSLKGENLISIILRDYKLSPHTNTRKHNAYSEHVFAHISGA